MEGSPPHYVAEISERNSLDHQYESCLFEMDSDTFAPAFFGGD